MNEPIELKTDNRYKDGNIIKRKGVYVGNSKMMKMERLEMPNNSLGLPFNLNPPIVISRELADKLKSDLSAPSPQLEIEP